MTGTEIQTSHHLFKSGRLEANIALNMNRNGGHFLNNEFRYFDGNTSVVVALLL